MHRFRFIGMVLLAVFAVGAVAASAAQAEEAPYWTVGGTRLEAGQTHFITLKTFSTEHPWVLSGGGVSVSCTTGEVLPHAVLLGSEPGEHGTNDEVVTFKSCEVSGNGSAEECKKVTEPINTANLKSELVLDKTKTKLLDLFQPASGSLLAELKFPKGCKIESTKVTGSVVGEALNETTKAPVETTSTKEQADSWLIHFGSQPAHVWLTKGGKGEEIEVKTLEAFGTVATLEGLGLILLAKVNPKTGELESEEAPWSPLA
jgi:hypothetical protein